MNSTLETIYSLRSIHGDFSERDIPQEDLDRILDACVRAANASARQSYSIVVVTDRKVIKENFGYPGSRALLFCVDYNRLELSAHHLKKEFVNKGVHSFITGSTDTILAAQTAAIAAKSLGIDSLFTNSVHRCDISCLYKTFNLPVKSCFPLIALILGYPNKEPETHKGRLTGKGVIHYEQYRLPDEKELDEIVAMYDDKEKHLGSISDWESLGFSHFLEWYFDEWEGPGNMEEKQREMFAVLKQAGFFDPDVID